MPLFRVKVTIDVYADSQELAQSKVFDKLKEYVLMDRDFTTMIVDEGVRR